MRNQPIGLGTLTVASGQTDSAALEFRKKPLRGITVFAPAALTGTVNIQVSGDAGSTWNDLYSGGIVVEVPAGSAVAVDFVGWDQLRIHSDASEGADRAFVIKGIEDMT